MATKKPDTKKHTKRKPVKVKVPELSVVRAPQADLDVAKLVLTGPKVKKQKQLTTKIRSAITTGSLEQTIQGASTLTLAITDWSEAMLKSEMIKGATTLGFDGLDYTLVKIARQDDIMTLTFEETAVNILRRYHKPKKANRKNTTRAQFVRSLVQEPTEARIPFKCPEVNEKQPIAKGTSTPGVRVSNRAQRWPISSR